MTNLLLRLTIPGYPQAGTPKARSAVGRLSGIVGIAANLLLFALKLLVGTISGSVSITADAMNNLSDASSAIVTFIGFKLAETPADEEHPYGHARYEYLSGLAVAAMIVVIGFELAKTSAEKIITPTPVALTLPVAAVLLGSIAVKLWLYVFNRRLGRLIDSNTLLATAADSRNDTLATFAVLLAAVVEAMSGIPIDGWMGLGVAVFILYSGATLAKETISPLLGQAASPQMRQLIIDTVTREPKVLGYHDLMVHDYGPGQRFASLHVEMDHREDPMLCHELIDSIERACMAEHNIHLVIHYDPIITGDPEMDALRSRVTEILTEMDSRLSIHDFRMVKGNSRTNLIFDVALPHDLTGRKKEIRLKLEQTLNEGSAMTYHAVITFDPAVFNQT